MAEHTGPLPGGEITRRVKAVQAEIRDRVLAHIEASEAGSLSEVAAETAGDTIYSVDRVSEDSLRELFAWAFSDVSVVLVGEGLEEPGEVFPPGVSADGADYRIIVDPIDGTRGLMYDKRPAWVLTGVARNRGEDTSLKDIFAAVQTEIPVRKQFRCDVLAAVAGEGVLAEGVNRFTGETTPLALRPSDATTLEHGFGMISRFFPGGKDVLARLEEDVAEALIGPIQAGKARLFEDQYICTGGQFYEMLVGHDRFNADLRPNLEAVLSKRGQRLGICCHPYDVCTELIAREAGLIITDPRGDRLDAPLDTTRPVAWVGYANASLHASIEPVLQASMRAHELL